ncbi:hypothetical protein A2W14_06260 [Candidatus Gottesmanbacteria bacterium RBG_16_37_8]|uniref:Uncharacterized protein n=1 Tax=Candidatus Gottesmanbacteria bacterium RBG_16_37_8 TaxID=1798371 RepID=A0A1F5YVP8_9BACT|nr:MAG: hypothetical protein A2W14_06260 [Candidatus Gottesmanbacteria bacterium RBG_16_37_8]
MQLGKELPTIWSSRARNGDWYILVNPHGCHIKGDGDDGTTGPAEMVYATLKKGAIPAKTGHNSFARVDEYLQTMENAGYPHLSLPGAEWGYHIPQSPTEVVEFITDERIHFGYFPGKDVFKTDLPVQFFPAVIGNKEIEQTRDEIVYFLAEHFNKPPLELVRLSSLRIKQLMDKLQGIERLNEEEKIELGTQLSMNNALTSREFIYFYLVFWNNVRMNLSEEDKLNVEKQFAERKLDYIIFTSAVF